MEGTILKISKTVAPGMQRLKKWMWFIIVATVGTVRVVFVEILVVRVVNGLGERDWRGTWSVFETGCYCTFEGDGTEAGGKHDHLGTAPLPGRRF